jgi:hypothetical protein
VYFYISNYYFKYNEPNDSLKTYSSFGSFILYSDLPVIILSVNDFNINLIDLTASSLPGLEYQPNQDHNLYLK